MSLGSADERPIDALFILTSLLMVLLKIKMSNWKKLSRQRVILRWKVR